MEDAARQGFRDNHCCIAWEQSSMGRMCVEKSVVHVGALPVALSLWGPVVEAY